MLCDIARNLSSTDLERISRLERALGLTILAYSCRTLDPDREARLQQAMADMGLPRPVQAAAPTAAEIERIREIERDLGVALVAVRD